MNICQQTLVHVTLVQRTSKTNPFVFFQNEIPELVFMTVLAF